MAGIARTLLISIPATAVVCVLTWLWLRKPSSDDKEETEEVKEQSTARTPPALAKNETFTQPKPPAVVVLKKDVSEESLASNDGETKNILVKEWVASTEQHFSSDWAAQIPDQTQPVKEEAVQRTAAPLPTRADKKPRLDSPNVKQTELSDERSDGSGDSGKGASLIGSSHLSQHYGSMIYEFEIPQSVVGLFIGRQGRTVGWIERKSGATVMVRKHPLRRDYQICSIEGTETQIDRALDTIAGKFQELDLTQVNIPDGGPNNTKPNNTKPSFSVPEVMQLTIPENVPVEVYVSQVVSAGHVFIQQPTHPSFMSLERLNYCMTGCYSQDDKIIPQLPRPIEVGVICACPFNDAWVRAQVVSVDHEKDEADVRILDYGGYHRMKCCTLKQIRSDFMTLPFQAVECYLSNISPLENEADFSLEAAAIAEELTQGKVLQCHSVASAEDGSPFIELLTVDGGSYTSVNRELVNRGVAQWVEASDVVSASPAS